MENSNEKSYPFCVKCNKQLNPQDSRGWEEIIIGGKDFGTIWLCPNCISKFQHTKDLTSILLKEQAGLYRALQVIKNFLNTPKG